MKWITGFVVGVIFGAAAIAFAADSGDFIYVFAGEQKKLTAPQASCFGTCAINAGLWDGLAIDLLSVSGQQTPDGFYAKATGKKYIAPASVADDDEFCILGRVP